MNVQNNNLPVWRVTNGWREVLARIFEGIETQFNVSPEWLVNPSTNRRLKLDMLYPDVRVAIRLEGLQGKQQKRRLSLEEEAQHRTRSDARVEVSKAHGIQLVVVNVAAGKPQIIFQQIDAALSYAGKNVDDNELLQQLKKARFTASSLNKKIIEISSLKLYADLWDDRQYRLVEQTAESQTSSAPSIAYAKGMEVEHTTFGPGVVIDTAASNGDTLITVDFITAGQKTLAASLVGNKLLPR